MNGMLWLALFVVAAAVGYRVLRAVPPLLHTPLMSGMNALSGITVLGALAAFRLAGSGFWQWIAGFAIAWAMANVVGGFLVTHRMLRMFGRKEQDRS